jgi:hypothetical protein
MAKWQHVVLGTRCSWLHGDPRGFRNRRHRIDSGGDYRNPPPEGEHEGLHRYFLEKSRKPVDFDVNVRFMICRAFVSKLLKMGLRVIAVSVGKRHLHALVFLIDDYRPKRVLIGRAKQHASHSVREFLPGRIWGEGGKFKPVDDAPYLRVVYDYIRTKQEPGTIVWSHNLMEDWIADPNLGVIIMAPGRKHERLFPASRV